MPVPELLSTKTQPPILPPGVVPRPHLVERLARGMLRKLTLISAPAGFGKTTLLCEWIAGRDQPVAWLSLDEIDSDPTRFWSYVAAALDGAHPGVASEALMVPGRLLRPAGHQQLLVPLVNRIAADNDSIVLILDDYHLIRSSHVHEGITYLIHNQPPNLHLILATRADPPLPLARLRAQGQLSEFRQVDLRFSVHEAQAFFASVLDQPLSPENVELLTKRAEGWPVGLRLASISLGQDDDPSAFVQHFAGTERLIVEFLVQEVLSGQPESVQNFMLQTSLLDQMSGPLCAALTGQSESTELLERMEQANLFLVALDRDRRWFRYHRLFADLLQGLLRRQHAEAIPLLHRRGSDWFEGHGRPHSAIVHALAAGDVERAADLVELAAEAALCEVKRTPSSVGLKRFPTLWFAGDHSSAPIMPPPCSHRASPRHGSRSGSGRQIRPQPARVSGEAMAVRGVLAGLSGDLETSAALSRQA